MMVGSITNFEKRIDRESENTEATIKLAQDFAAHLRPGDLVAFYGKLGSGKTLFIKAICQELGVVQEATSPSFTIMNEYKTAEHQFIYHFDFFRIENTNELQQLGLDEFFYGDSICLVEWADRIKSFLPAHRWDISINFLLDKPECRMIEIQKRK
jgi:tRNA threonylcarbamoyladenosine biosynthesis protein TsaE